jgi:Trypsin-co-occurring domain 1
MEFRESRTEPVSALLDNGGVIKIEVAQTGREDVAFDIRPFKEVTTAIEGIVEAVAATLYKVSPSKAVVKFGIDVTIDSGKLTAMIVQGSSKANLEITLEWERSNDGAG